MFNFLAASMPDISMKDVDGCRKMSGRSSWFLLRIWASKGYRIEDLRTLFIYTRYLRCLAVLDKYRKLLTISHYEKVQ